MSFKAFEQKNVTKHFPRKSLQGKLCWTAEGYAYLDLDDAIIHSLFPYLKIPDIELPNYFSEDKNFIGAHISVVYSNEWAENLTLDSAVVNDIQLLDVATLLISRKQYYVVRVQSDWISMFRRQYDLPDKLNFRGHSVEPHITIGIVNQVR
jgi:hypothetical protein